MSHPAQKMPNYRQEITFRAYGVDGRTQDGKFNCIYSGASERFEVIFGDYHAIGLHFPGTNRMLPSLMPQLCHSFSLR